MTAVRKLNKALSFRKKSLFVGENIDLSRTYKAWLSAKIIYENAAFSGGVCAVKFFYVLVMVFVAEFISVFIILYPKIQLK